MPSNDAEDDSGGPRSLDPVEDRYTTYHTHVIVKTTRQTTPPGCDPSSMDDRLDADIESDTVFRGVHWFEGESLDDALGVIDTGQLENRVSQDAE